MLLTEDLDLGVKISIKPTKKITATQKERSCCFLESLPKGYVRWH